MRKIKIRKFINYLKKESLPLQEFILLRWHFVIYITAITVIYYELGIFSKETHLSLITHMNNLQNKLLEQKIQMYDLKTLWRQFNDDVGFKAYKPQISESNIARDMFIEQCKLRGAPKPNEVLCLDLWWDYKFTYAQVFGGLHQLILYMVLFLIFLEVDYYLHKNAHRYYYLSNLFCCIIVIAMLFYQSLSVEFLICQTNHLAAVLPENDVLLEQVSGLMADQKKQYDNFHEWELWKRNGC